MTTLFWFRNDLRLSDNPALTAAVKSSNDLLLIYILDDAFLLRGAQRWWLHHSLVALQAALKKKGVTLLLKKGDSKKILTDLIQKHKVQAIYWNRCYEPELLKRDTRLERYFSTLGVKVYTYNGSLLTEPSEIKNKSGHYFKVFTPYWRAVKSKIEPRKCLPIPRSFKQQTKVTSERIESWNLLPKHPDWSKGFDIWTVGEKGAHQQLKRFINKALLHYAANRDRPDVLGTSRLSAYLHFGEMSIWQVWNAISEVAIAESRLRKSADVFLKQLIWREFAYYLLFHLPQLPKRNFHQKFDAFQWKSSQTKLRAWQKGKTGYPIVDAGMRELWTTGYMHNRVRMIVASFLTKDLLIDWRKGAQWFMNTLVDADLANNTLGWQWVAGSGPDAAPYFRIFNPILQSKKFDPNGDYIRKWVPELLELPNKHIHDPSNAPQTILKDADILLGKDYPLPIIDHKAAYQMAMKVYKKIK